MRVRICENLVFDLCHADVPHRALEFGIRVLGGRRRELSFAQNRTLPYTTGEAKTPRYQRGAASMTRGIARTIRDLVLQ